MSSIKPHDLVLAVAVTAVWGLNFVVIRIGVDVIAPIMLSAARFLFAALPMVFFVPRPRIPLLSFLGISVCLGIVSFAFLFIGIDFGVSPGIASLVLQSQVFFTAAFAFGLLREACSLNQVLGLFLVIPGMAILLATAGGSSTLVGLLLILGAAASWAIANLFMKQSSQVGMLSLMVWVSLVPPVPLIALSLIFEGVDANLNALAEIGAKEIGAVVYLAYAATIFGFGGWARLIARYGAARIAPFSLLVPVFGMASSALLLGEAFGALQLLAATLIIAGLAVSLWRKADQTNPKSQLNCMGICHRPPRRAQ